MPIISWWGNLADNPGGKLDGFEIFFFGVVPFGKSCAVLTSKSPNADVDANDNVEHYSDAVNNNGGNNNTDNNNNDDCNNNNKKTSVDDDNCCFDSNDACFFVSEPLLLDLHFMTAFVGVTIEIDSLHWLSSTGVWFLFFFHGQLIDLVLVCNRCGLLFAFALDLAFTNYIIERCTYLGFNFFGEENICSESILLSKGVRT